MVAPKALALALGLDNSHSDKGVYEGLTYK